jgi:hypothetical protein
VIGVRQFLRAKSKISQEVFICFNSYHIIFGGDPSSIDIEIKKSASVMFW